VEIFQGKENFSRVEARAGLRKTLPGESLKEPIELTTATKFHHKVKAHRALKK
jgi:hypothetical protein